MLRTATLLVAVAGAGLAASGLSLAQAAEGNRDAGARAERMLLAQGGGFDALRARTKGNRSGDREQRSRGDNNASEDNVSDTATEQREENSRGDDNASDTAVEQANENSAVGGPEEAVPPDLSNLEVGMTVRAADGVEVGTIERVNRDADGTVRNVIVARANGQGNMTLAPGSLSVAGDVVTTTTVVPQE